MNATSFITFFTYMLRQNVIRFYKLLYPAFRLAQDIKLNKIYLRSYSLLIEGQSTAQTNLMH